ncbi:hypothetical protein BDBG_17786 [Blastomyces gilchristii SLH14081]|uniref:Uncharacterized protein n=1 Tax=Blastomyces gilchristii (strain SLH14081) TaxID=559298 RepID=A0A179V401_BLAGS|nr:uncharacterized protein BDBG_17786 [Blastomyces gilchristii SLH14081]OAT13322.1 hypothetical protein BDBG_17786 [Blastomyces gilchristii SLH14081]
MEQAHLLGIDLVWACGAILELFVGIGFWDSSATWQWGYYINSIIDAITSPVYLFSLLSIHPARSEPLEGRLASLDCVATFVLSAGMWTTFAMGLIFTRGMWQRNDGRAFTVGLLSLLFIPCNNPSTVSQHPSQIIPLPPTQVLHSHTVLYNGYWRQYMWVFFTMFY